MDYTQIAAMQIVHDLNFSEEQLDLIGRVLSLEDNKDLVRFVELGGYGNIFDMHAELFYINNPRVVYSHVVLQNNLYDESHENVETKVRKALSDKGISTEKIFSYCSHSYGIENMNGISIIIGGTPWRTDMKLHPRDIIRISS